MRVFFCRKLTINDSRIHGKLTETCADYTAIISQQL